MSQILILYIWSFYCLTSPLYTLSLQNMGSNSSLHLPVPCNYKQLLFFTIPLCRHPAIYPYKLFRYFIHCYPVSLFYQYNVCIKFFKTFLPHFVFQNWNCLFMILRISVLFIIIFIKISSWLTCSKYVSSPLIFFPVFLTLFVSISENNLYLLSSKPYFIYFMSWISLIFAGVTVGVIFKQVFQNSTS